MNEETEAVSRKKLFLKLYIMHAIFVVSIIAVCILFFQSSVSNPSATQITITVLLLLIFAGAYCWFVARRITKPLRNLENAATRFADGELDFRIAASPSGDLSNLASSLNEMASSLDEKLRAIRLQRNELDAVLTSMTEGVIAVDRNEKVLRMNQSARQFLKVTEAKPKGRLIQEIVRNSDFHSFVSSSLSSDENVEAEIKFFDGDELRYLQGHSSPLEDSDGKAMGVLLVLSDITRLRRLEIMRRDFVANVSHELKTPITSIKGFVETLLDGALKSPEDANRFLKIVEKHSDRLNNLIDDLLSLSKIESEQDYGHIPLEKNFLKPIAESAMQLCDRQAEKKEISIRLDAPDDIVADVCPPLLERGITNLIDNAIKYSTSKSDISVRIHKDSDETVISVQDQGQGIPEEHIPRLFERFYRVDESRSRDIGGTGLGLAIVKHVAQAHKGYPTVESSPGRGSVFSIHLPR